MSTIYRTLRTSLHSVRRNALRSGLTCLGITIGIMAVIAMVEIGQGASYAIERTMATIGANVVQIDPAASSVGGVSSGGGGKATLTTSDCFAILNECGAVQWASPSVDCRMQLVYKGRNWSPSNILGTSPDFLAIRNWTRLQAGEPFTDHDVRSAALVCLIGQTVRKQLFQDGPAVGEEMRAGSVRLKIVGVLSAKGANMLGRDQDDIVIAPWTSVKFRMSGARSSVAQSGAVAAAPAIGGLSQLYPAQRRSLYPQKSSLQTVDYPMIVRFADLDDVFVSANSPQDVPVAMKQIAQLLRERHRLEEGQPDDFRIRDLTEISESAASTTRLTTSLLLVVALISLIVGGVGIMNIMLVSVTERTREIGLRMAVGARPVHILHQFLLEAILLCLLGGITGIVLGRGTSMAVTAILQWPTLVSIPAIFAACTVAVGTGIVFGFYPAWKASRLDPIDALHYE